MDQKPRSASYRSAQDGLAKAMGTLIQIIFRDASPKNRRTTTRATHSRRRTIAHERGLKLWSQREDFILAVAYRLDRVDPVEGSQPEPMAGPAIPFHVREVV
jgi:hypothetical protein